MFEKINSPQMGGIPDGFLYSPSQPPNERYDQHGRTPATWV